MRFPKPAFDDLVANYKTDPESVHDCPRIYTKNPININTCAIRITEALVLANHLIESRVKIAGLTTKGGTGKGFLLGNYGYRANLCPHGIGRGATDVGYFLTEHWGKPNHTWLAPGSPPKRSTASRECSASPRSPATAARATWTCGTRQTLSDTATGTRKKSSSGSSRDSRRAAP
ncbi:MAG: hypothetical protein R3F14_42305 [Polyangiaceae bacterium]